MAFVDRSVRTHDFVVIIGICNQQGTTSVQQVATSKQQVETSDQQVANIVPKS